MCLGGFIQRFSGACSGYSMELLLVQRQRYLQIPSPSVSRGSFGNAGNFRIASGFSCQRVTADTACKSKHREVLNRALQVGPFCF